MKKFWIISSLLLLTLASCKKNEMEITKFPVNTTQGNNRVTFSWSPQAMSDFKNVTIYRSSQAIPDPEFGKTIDGSLLISTISDRTVTSFVDSNMIMNNTGTSYYKLVVTFGTRFIVSDLITVNRNGFSIVLSVSNSGGSVNMIKFPEIHKLYFINYNAGTIKVIDYQTKAIGPSISYLNSGILPLAVMNAGNPELFVYTNSQIYCYDANTLAPKYNFNISSIGSINNFCVKNNYLYVIGYYNNQLYTYSLSTKTLINTQSFSSNINYNTTKLFPGPNNSLFFRYYTSYYSSTYSKYFYVNTVKIMKTPGGIPTDSALVNPAVLNPDSTINNYNYYYMNLSPDGKYLTLNSTGDIYCLANNSMHNVLTSSFNPTLSFSTDGQYLVSRPNNQFAGYSVDVFSLPACGLYRNVRSANASTSSVSDDFTSHDTLISYNVTSLFQTGQVTVTLNVGFSKID